MSGVDISPEAVDRVLRALFTAPKGVDEFVDVQEVAYSLSARIAELEAKLKEAGLSELSALGQAMDAYTAQLEAEAKLAKARADALKEAAAEIDCGGCYGQCADPANCRVKEAQGIRDLIEKETK